MTHHESPEAAFGPHLKALRTAGGLSQRELADHMTARGYSWQQSTVAKTESGAGRRPLRLNEFVSLCAVLDQDPGQLLNSLLIDGSMREKELRFAALHLNLEHARREAERVTAQAEERLKQMNAAQAALDEFVATELEQR